MKIASRLRILALSMILALLPTTAAIVMVTRSATQFLSRMDDEWATIAAATEVERAVIDAETAQRGYLLSGSAVYRSEYELAAARAADALRDLRARQHGAEDDRRKIDAVVRPAQAELALLGRLPSEGRVSALEVVNGQQGRFEAQELRHAVRDLNISLDLSFSAGAHDVYGMLAAGRWLALLGALIGIVAVLLSLTVLGRYLRNAVQRILDAMHGADASGLPAEVAPGLVGEFRELADAYNDMCARMRSGIAKREIAEARVAELLSRSDEALADRQRASDILARISNRLPACLDQQELVALATRFIPQLFAIRGGALYFLNNSSTVLTRVASWGDCTSSQTEFAPTRCWALRRGQQHHVTDVSADVTCAHLSTDALNSYICLPLIAQGETVGLLYLEDRGDGDTSTVGRELEDMRVLCENLALALVNLRLRESLRHQTLRDPLTGLHNRRYLEEAIDLEFAKSRRNEQPVSVIVADIDHFKHVNDTFGHDAGDIVLRKFAAALSTCVRRGDVACRFGGEEFLILLPGLTHEEALQRAELVREQIRNLALKTGDTDIGQVTASFGVATFTGGEDAPADIIRSADQALYHAKATGRDKVVSDALLRPALPAVLAA